MSEDYDQFYDLEKYLFETVNQRFKDTNEVTTFDFFCIVIWKANRAKSKIATKMIDIASNGYPKSRDKKALDAAVMKLVKEIIEAKGEKEKLNVLIKWKFLLPMASAILTVLYPDKFTVFDVRVCRELDDFVDATNKTAIDSIWQRYLEYRDAVKEAKVPDRCKSLREKDRYLWAKSFARDLEQNIKDGFSKASGHSSNSKTGE